MIPRGTERLNASIESFLRSGREEFFFPADGILIHGISFSDRKSGEPPYFEEWTKVSDPRFAIEIGDYRLVATTLVDMFGVAFSPA